ncbi:MAG: signal recognition particle-docking protein FtsY, partial [Dehalococcoidia bacterium]|nr:signal recognition particle-docking protein FtsY [Dehalococcoidia bacterium]
DASTGQNGLSQAKAFAETAQVTSVMLTKLDGSAKGGIVFAIARDCGLPVRFVGTGQQGGDLAPFDPHGFVAALLGDPAVEHAGAEA